MQSPFSFSEKKKLPEIGSGLGKAISSFKRGISEAEDSGRDVLDSMSRGKEIADTKETFDQPKNIGKNLK